ncbi:ABC-type transport system involved in multi-copper enzyme maturation, permease component [Limihaloglobus sulfuriphilus]|uniref:ABC-type transport system involved in multi-copper enzyme maturation, permease component n=1 Tax=Limihaloglobus sulfuriphilus TaxID=1851148 RepID=A0A1R7T5X3_9BACT|nr:ABC transporter permease subunit [Limihaloglobus sulfuriphilus]AQQ71933.1 ABC-type transport system involved in multi-copper enzyme maturation, permease component [Limihaloglobus sulfuriphilus]
MIPAKITAIAANTFKETIRQPIFGIIVFLGILIFIFSPSITMYSIDDDNKLLRELGFSTLFLAGLFIAVFSSTGAIVEELENKTVMTVLTKPIPRWGFILGKFLGLVLAVAIAHYILTVAMMFVQRHGVMSTASDELDWTVITAGIITICVSILLATLMNYISDWSFIASSMIFMAALATVFLGILFFIDRHWQVNIQENGLHAFDAYSSILLFLAVTIMVAAAVLFSTRLNLVGTLLMCIAVFLLGLISDYIFGRYADTYLWAKLGRLLVPNFQVFWISDAIYQESKITVSYIWKALSYAACYTAGILALAGAAFQNRQMS